MTNFTARFESPSYQNKWYIKKNAKYGGYNKAMLIDEETGSVLPNCCGLVHGRWLECVGITDASKDNLCLGNAGSYWKKNDGYERGQTPKIGSVICWSSHVAFVEEVKEDGTIRISSSTYNGVRYTVKTLRSPYRWNEEKALGFIYNPYVEEPKPEDLKVGDKVKIIGTGNARADGKGRTAYGRYYIRYIYKIYPQMAFPYRVGFMNGQTTGYYKSEALLKIE